MRTHPIFIDLYELTMAATYFSAGRVNDQATFDLFVRRLPSQRNYMVFTGLAAVITHLESLHFDSEDIEYLRTLGLFTEDFLNYLKNFRFSGQIESLSEGEIFFGSEPIMKVTAPLIEAQIIETSLINIVHLHSLLATKASRVVSASKSKSVIDFGARRSHGQDAAMAAAYTSYLVGADGTSNVLAGKTYKIPVFGTMAHSFIQSFATESEAFNAYLKQYPTQNTLLIDTYDPLIAAQIIGDIAHSQALNIQAVRIDSGDLVEVTREVRKILDGLGLKNINIFLSGDLDEKTIAEFIAIKLPVDGFGVGTKMDTSIDAPTLEMVYKLSHIVHGSATRDTMKDSPQKQNLPGLKQAYRVYKNNVAVNDIVGLVDETPLGEPLLQVVFKDGQSMLKSQDLLSLRKAHQQRLKSFPNEILSVSSAYNYPVMHSDKLQDLIRKTKRQ